jgi:hypothetical protein
MLGFFYRWIDRRRQLRALWQADARRLIFNNELMAYYDAQRLVARSRAMGDKNGFWHWSKVAAEVARLSDKAGMDVATVRAIADEELGHPGRGQSE